MTEITYKTTVNGDCGLENPSLEPEITPEMIEAGRDVLRRYNPVYDRTDTTVSDIYREMVLARR